MVETLGPEIPSVWTTKDPVALPAETLAVIAPILARLTVPFKTLIVATSRSPTLTYAGKTTRAIFTRQLFLGSGLGRLEAGPDPVSRVRNEGYKKALAPPGESTLLTKTGTFLVSTEM